MASPRVSILTATWNRGHTLGRGIQSALDQTFTDWELIIAGDGPPPETEAVIREWVEKDKRITYVRIEHAGRIAIVSNAGLKAARGEYVAILDDDDWWEDPEKLAKQVAFLDEHKEYIGCGGGLMIVNESEAITSKIIKPETDAAIRRVALFANPMANSSTMFRREQTGLYDESLSQFADWDFWLSAGTKGKLYNFPEYFLAYRMWNQGSSFVNEKQNVASAFRVIRKHKNEYPGYWFAFASTSAYWLYARLPWALRRRMNATLSQLKKRMFAGRVTQTQG